MRETGAPVIPDVRALAVIAVDQAIRDRPGYCSIKRDLAIEAIASYEPAYIQSTDYSDQWGANACIWANGGLLGLPHLDPPQPLHGLRAVLNWRQRELGSEEFDRWMRHAARVLVPLNAMAQLDTEIMITERSLDRREVAAA